ncbi:MAG TPA: hypothetical protein VGQ42_15590 [Candidatus Dormibacteraeota bacterium]|jgi:hypothetical protein|nr:hypothetical protein [Candidatus Dormibacteraeota bacterium]
MSLVVQPTTLQGIIDSLDRRVAALETMQPPALASLGNSVVSITQVMANVVVPMLAAVPASNIAFTLPRARRLMVCGTSSFFVNTGTSTFGYIYLAVVDGGGNVVTDLDGKSGITGRQAIANNVAGTGGTAISGNGSQLLTLRLPPGSYTAQFQYALRDGNSSWQLTTGNIDAYVMGG